MEQVSHQTFDLFAGDHHVAHTFSDQPAHRKAKRWRQRHDRPGLADDFANRPVLGSGTGAGLASSEEWAFPAASGFLNLKARVSNCRAHKEPGEPDHAGNPGGRSVWWQWTAPASGGAQGSAAAGEERAKRQVASLLRRLPANYRRVLELRFIQRLTVAETADRMGITRSNAKVLQYRALRKAALVGEGADG